MKIAFLGLGAMGSRMASRLIAAGADVTVWNRTAARGEGLAPARIASSPRDAATGAQVVFSMVRDDQASAAVWLDAETGALAALTPDAIAVECSTVSLPHTRGLAAECARQGYRFLDAPLAGSRPQAEAGQLIFFVGGAAVDLDHVRPLLGFMGGAVHHVGSAGAGMTVKLMVNALLGAQIALLGELIGFADRAGVDLAVCLDSLAATPVCSPAAKLAAAAMVQRSFSPAFPIDLVVKDFDLIVQSGQALSAEMPLSEATRQIYETARNRGFGNDNITGVVQVFSHEGADSPPKPPRPV